MSDKIIITAPLLTCESIFYGNTKLNEIVITGEKMVISDGSHTFDELYDHRITLFIALCRVIDRNNHIIGNETAHKIWRSKSHSDGSGYVNCFILGIRERAGEQITYHLPIERWGETDFAETLNYAPTWDNHTPADVLERLKSL